MAGETVIRKLMVAIGIMGGQRAGKDLSDLRKQTTRLKGSLTKMVRDLAIVKTGLAAMAGAALYQAHATAREAEAIDRRSRSLQLSRREYQRHLAVFEQFGADGSDIADAFGTITDRAQDAIDGMQSYIDDFALVGIQVDDLRGKDPAGLYELFADKVASAADKNKALTATVRILGDDLGAKLLPMLQLGAGGMSAMGDEAEAMGAVMSSKALDASLSLQSSWRKLGLVVKGLRNEIGVALAPVVEDVITSIRDWTMANGELIRSGITSWVSRLRAPLEAVGRAAKLIDTLIKRTIGYDNALKGLVAAGGLAGTLLLVKRLVPIVDSGSKAWRDLASATAKAGMTGAWALTPVTIALGAIVAFLAGAAIILDDFWVTMQGGDSLMNRFIDRFSEAEGFVGSIARLFKVSMRSARAIITIISEGGDEFADWLMSFEAVQNVAEKLQTLFGNIKSIFSGIADIAGKFLTKGITDRLATLIDAYANAFESGPLRFLEATAGAVSAPVGPAMAAAATSNSSSVVNNNQRTTTIDNRPTVTVQGGSGLTEGQLRDAVSFRQAQEAAGGVR